MEQSIVCKSEEVRQTKGAGAALGRCLRAGDVVLLAGDLGAGKTQFVQGVARALGVTGEVTSPTFNLLFSYEGVGADGNPLVLHHFDLYRLEEPAQLVDIDFAGTLESGGVCFIEWAEKFPQAMPEDSLKVNIAADGTDARTVSASCSGPRSQELLRSWQGELARLQAGAPREGGPSNPAQDGGRDADAESLETPLPDGGPASPAADGRRASGVSRKAAPAGARDVVLAFDTSNEMIALALGRMDAATRSITPLATRELPAHRASNTQLLPAIDEMMAQQGVARGNLAGVACGRGPGSFTGVRICMATAKGVAMALEVGLYGLSTPDAVAWRLWAEGVRGTVAVVADAMRKEVYPVRYQIDDSGIRRQNADVVMKAAGGVAFVGAPDLIAGDALVKYRELYEPLAPLAPQELWTPTGAGLLLALQDRWRSGEVDPFDASSADPAVALPVYTRLSDAEENERIRLSDEAPRDLRTGVQHGGTVPAATSAAAEGLRFLPLDAAHAADVARMEDELMGSDAWNEAMVRDDLVQAGRLWWAAYAEGGELAGYVGAMVVDGDMQVLKIATARNRQRQGIATRLLAHAAEDARALGAETVSLEVRVGNEGAIAFYGALGFENIGRRPRYYSDREDAYILKAPLSGLLATGAHTVGGMEIRSIGQPAGTDDALPSRDGRSEGAGAFPAAGSQADAGSPAAVQGAIPAGPSRGPRASEGARAHAPLILAIESSCDETAAAVVDADGTLHSDVLASQINFHSRFGGVVPEIASRKHIEAICGVVQEGLDVAAASLGGGKLHLRDLDAIAATYAPGLVGALVVGVAFAKGAAWGADVPFIGVNHLEGHLYANKIAQPDIRPPMVVSLVSGGHTMLVHVRGWGDYETMGSTIDDAVGEAFDKVAKALGLGYPGGPVISKLAAQGNPKAVRFPRAMMHSGDLRFSLSGLKTAVITYLQKERAAGRELNLPDIAASFQQAVIDVQVAKASRALEETGAREFCLGGGVAANPALREAYRQMCGRMGVRLTMPPLSSCTDNAGMISLVALERYNQGRFFDLGADVQAHAPLDDPY